MKNPSKDEKEENRVYRGGSWSSFAWMTRVSYRNRDYPVGERYDLGFRVVRNSDEKSK